MRMSPQEFKEFIAPKIEGIHYGYVDRAELDGVIDQIVERFDDQMTEEFDRGREVGYYDGWNSGIAL